MTTTELIGPDLKTVLRRLKLGRMLDTLPERVLLARQQKMPHQDVLLLALSDEATRRDSLAVALRVQRARLDPAMHLDAWDPTAKVTFGRARRQSASRSRPRTRRVSTGLQRLCGPDRSHAQDAEARAPRSLLRDRSAQATRRRPPHPRRLCLDALDPTESRDLYEVLTERHRAGSIVVTSNRGPDEWLVTFADPIRAQSGAIDRFTSNAYDLVIDGESYRSRLKPTLAKERRPA